VRLLAFGAFTAVDRLSRAVTPRRNRSS